MLRKTLSFSSTCAALPRIATATVVFSLCFTTFLLIPRDVEAQRRVVRRGTTRTIVHVAARPYYSAYYPPFRYGWYGAGWYGGGWHGAGWYGSPAWYGWHPYGFHRFSGQYYPHYPHRYDYTGSARLEVKPREAQVYVDGYFVGTVDDFDGWLQRLHVPYGEHEIQIYLPGYRTIREKVLIRPGATVKISGTLEPLPAGEAPEPSPSPTPGSQPPSSTPRGPYPPGQRREGIPPSESGGVAIRVQPADAEVLIDGERWEAPQGGERLVVQLTEGEHRVEIRRDGYRPYSTTIRVRRGETVPLNVSLSRQEGA